MDLNKLTKKELVAYGDDFGLSLNIRDKKETLISKFFCACCGDKLSRENEPFGIWLWPDSDTTLDTRVYDESVILCGMCHAEWGDPDVGEKVELNPKTGKLRYVPIDSEDKYRRIKNKVGNLDGTKSEVFLKGWSIVFLILVAIVIVQLIFGL